MGKFNRLHRKRSEDAGLGGVRKGSVPLMRTQIPGVGFLAGKAVLYKRLPGRALEVYPRSGWNMFIIFCKINKFLARRKIDSIFWHIREARDHFIIGYRMMKEKLKNARNPK